MTGTGSDRAVVLGGSVTGLLAARVLADACPEVVVVERDELPAGAEHRRGVPQGRHVHGLLARGGEALEELFPGMTRGLIGHGVPVGDMLADTRLYFGGHLFRAGTSGLTVLGASRPTLEAHLRDRVRELAGVKFLEGCDAVGLTSPPDRGRVRGVRVIRRRPGSAEEVLAADLVVDATGRGSRTPTWLADLGHPRPTEESVQVGVGYASRTYRLTPADLGGTMAILAAPTPAHPRGGALAAMEGGRYILTLFGMLGDHPPTDPRGFSGFAARLPFPDLYDAVQAAEPLDEPVAFRYPASVRRRYERLPRFPDGLLVMGDAVATFNPIYGQGISVAALQALALRRHLPREPWPPSPIRLLHEVGRVVDVAWELATGADLTFPDVLGRRTARMRTINRYVARVQAAAADDPGVGRAFLRVTGLVDPPQALLRPAVAARVARHALTGGTRGEISWHRETAVQQGGRE
jgi:2-polyprenyl-6-methoxyphenol hydroxylase-like FAD-dependent oxidoreductase